MSKKENMTKSHNLVLGREGEIRAISYLYKKGYSILERNYRSKFGEIDIIAEYQGSLIFIEVKTRSSFNYGAPCMAVDRRKLIHIKKTAWQYLLGKEAEWTALRIDVIELIKDDDRYYIRHLEGVG